MILRAKESLSFKNRSVCRNSYCFYGGDSFFSAGGGLLELLLSPIC